MLIRKLLLIITCIAKVLGYKTIIDALSEDERFTTLLKHLQTFRLVPLLNKLEAGTMFAPDNEAFEKYEFKLDRSVLLYHVIKKGMTSNEFYNGQLKQSLRVLPGYLGSDIEGQRIKITTNRNTIYVNEAKVITSDIQVNNLTYIQVIDRVLEPPPLIGDVMEMRNKAVYDLMATTDIIDLLKKKKPFTVFLTTKKKPLKKFNAIEEVYLGSKYGQGDLSYLFKYAIIDKAIYMDEFNSGKTTFKSLSGDSLVVASGKDKKTVTVNDIPISQSDVIAANGVIHEIDEVFDSPSGIVFNARKYMYGSNSSYMVELFDEYGLDHYIDQTEENYSFLIPPNDAMNKSILSAPWLSYHIINGSWPQEKLIDNMLLNSAFNSSELGNQPQKLPIYVESEDVLLTANMIGQSIQFGHGRVVGESLNVHDDIIYQISEPLSVPGDILGTLVLDLELSTFIATLYVSKVVDEIKGTKGLTLFVPTNEAFQNLGLVAKYLVHPTAKTQLQTVLRYHAAETLLYHDDMKNKVHEIRTLANATLRISQNESGSILIGNPEGSTPATVCHANMLVSNGVVHKISQVQIPNQVKITNQDLLVGIESKTMKTILEKSGLLDKINEENIVVLAPSEKAFSHIDLDYLYQNLNELERLAKLHIIPREWQDRWIQQQKSTRDKSEYPTLLSEDDKVTIRENEKGELFIEVKNGGESDRAHVTGLGRVSAGGGVIAIDAVLIPIRRGLFGLPLIWSIIVTLIIIILASGILSIVGFFGYKIYNRRRLGYRPIYE